MFDRDAAWPFALHQRGKALRWLAGAGPRLTPPRCGYLKSSSENPGLIAPPEAPSGLVFGQGLNFQQANKNILCYVSASMIRTALFHSFWRIACFLFLAMVCCGQVYQSVHLHHVHINDSVAFEVSSHPLPPSVSHASTHHHHEENTSHEDENEHKLKNKTDWNVARSKSATNLSFDAPAPPTPVYSLPPLDFANIRPSLQALHCKKEPNASFLPIRGPPPLA